MGAEHKPPLYAFVVVMVVGAIVMVVAARSEAFRDEMLKRTVVVAGSALDRVSGERAPSAAENTEPPAPLTAPEADAAHEDTQERAAQPRRDRDRAAGPGRSGKGDGHAKGHGPGGKGAGNALGHGVGNGLAQAPGLVTAPGQQGKSKSKAQGKSQSHGQGKSQGKGKGKGNGKGRNG